MPGGAFDGARWHRRAVGSKIRKYDHTGKEPNDPKDVKVKEWGECSCGLPFPRDSDASFRAQKSRHQAKHIVPASLGLAPNDIHLEIKDCLIVMLSFNDNKHEHGMTKKRWKKYHPDLNIVVSYGLNAEDGWGAILGKDLHSKSVVYLGVQFRWFPKVRDELTRCPYKAVLYLEDDCRLNYQKKEYNDEDNARRVQKILDDSTGADIFWAGSVSDFGSNMLVFRNAGLITMWQELETRRIFWKDASPWHKWIHFDLWLRDSLALNVRKYEGGTKNSLVDQLSSRSLNMKGGTRTGRATTPTKKRKSRLQKEKDAKIAEEIRKAKAREKKAAKATAPPRKKKAPAKKAAKKFAPSSR